jgi:hypothetical protein
MGTTIYNFSFGDRYFQQTRTILLTTKTLMIANIIKGLQRRAAGKWRKHPLYKFFHRILFGRHCYKKKGFTAWGRSDHWRSARRQYARPNVPFQLQDRERAIGTSYPFKSSMCVPAYVVTTSCYYNLDAALQYDDAAIQQRGFDVVAI